MALGNVKNWNRAAVIILIFSLSIPIGISSGGTSAKGSQAISPENSMQLMEYEQLMSLSKEDLGLYLTGIKLMLVDWEKSQATHHPELVAGNTSEQLKFLDRAFAILVAESVWAKPNPSVLPAASPSPASVPAPAATPATSPAKPALPAASPAPRVAPPAVKPSVPSGGSSSPAAVRAPVKVKPAPTTASVPQSCVYAGWISTRDSKGYCQRPKVCEGDASKNSVQCNPLLFGKGVCVSVATAEDRKKATVTCFQNSKPNSNVVEEIKLSASEWKTFNESFGKSTAPCNRVGAPPYCKVLSDRLRELNVLLRPSVAVKESKRDTAVVSKGKDAPKKGPEKVESKAGKASVERRDRVAESRGARTRSVSGPTRRQVARDTGDDGESDDGEPSDEDMPEEDVAEAEDGGDPPPAAGSRVDGAPTDRRRTSDDGEPQYGGDCRPHALDFNAAFPGSEEPSPILSFEQAQDLICRSKFDQKLVDSRLEFLRRQIASFNTKSRAETDYYHRLWTQLKENLVACVGLVKNRSQQGIKPRGISPQFRLNFGGAGAGIITSSKRGVKIGRNQIDRLYVDRDSLGASLYSNGIVDICSVEVLSGSSTVPATGATEVTR
ncbi:MAG: hypothetical protein IPL83_02720 [Bdellovibrionales bacterium]|nr:hypothetical protein [Bdellovibrionales bacterium]